MTIIQKVLVDIEAAFEEMKTVSVSMTPGKAMEKFDGAILTFSRSIS